MGFNTTVGQLSEPVNNGGDGIFLVLIMESKIDCTSRIPISTSETVVPVQVQKL